MRPFAECCALDQSRSATVSTTIISPHISLFSTPWLLLRSAFSFPPLAISFLFFSPFFLSPSTMTSVGLPSYIRTSTRVGTCVDAHSHVMQTSDVAELYKCVVDKCKFSVSYKYNYKPTHEILYDSDGWEMETYAQPVPPSPIPVPTPTPTPTIDPDPLPPLIPPTPIAPQSYFRSVPKRGGEVPPHEHIPKPTDIPGVAKCIVGACQFTVKDGDSMVVREEPITPLKRGPGRPRGSGKKKQITDVVVPTVGNRGGRRTRRSGGEESSPPPEYITVSEETAVNHPSFNPTAKNGKQEIQFIQNALQCLSYPPMKVWCAEEWAQPKYAEVEDERERKWRWRSEVQRKMEEFTVAKWQKKTMPSYDVHSTEFYEDDYDFEGNDRIFDDIKRLNPDTMEVNPNYSDNDEDDNQPLNKKQKITSPPPSLPPLSENQLHEAIQSHNHTLVQVLNSMDEIEKQQREILAKLDLLLPLTTPIKTPPFRRPKK